jgi:hypothetical protein
MYIMKQYAYYYAVIVRGVLEKRSYVCTLDTHDLHLTRLFLHQSNWNGLRHAL